MQNINSNKKIKATELTLQDLIREAFSIPDGWKEEIYVENGYVEFSSPMTPNTYTAKADNPREPVDWYVADLESMRISDFEGFAEQDGTIRADGETLTYDEAIEAIAANIIYSSSTLNDILRAIQQKAT